jgi:hypothetical protein
MTFETNNYIMVAMGTDGMYIVTYDKNDSKTHVLVKYIVNADGEVHIKIVNYQPVDKTVLERSHTLLLKNDSLNKDISVEEFESILISGMVNTIGELVDSMS